MCERKGGGCLGAAQVEFGANANRWALVVATTVLVELFEVFCRAGSSCIAALSVLCGDYLVCARVR